VTDPSALTDVEQVRGAVDGLLVEHVDALAGELERIGPDSAELVAALTTMLSGGKRLRAAFCYWSWRAHGGSTDDGSAGRADRDQVLRVGAALELFQAAALFHDDVMDDSDMRRGRPAAHRQFADRHAAQGWSGPAQRFGESAAILLGDLALIASEREFARAVDPLDPASRARARDVFDRMRTEVTVGQYLDVLAQALPWGQDPPADEERARSVIRAKSARYSVEHPVSLGAALAGADDAALDRCADVGLPLGEAFQLRDDLLGVYGDPSATGKPAGDDLREGKRTVLVARAMQTASVADRDAVLAGLGRRDLSDHDIETLRAAIGRSGAVEAVEDLIRTLSEPALEAWAQGPLTEPGRSMLVSLGRAAVDRHS
jgi:geranylgeranyl diphosphate synthase type I